MTTNDWTEQVGRAGGGRKKITRLIIPGHFTLSVMTAGKKEKVKRKK